ncbi:Uu.00g112680.m01.CDS01 [Anthostomella pinea]|uniref:Lysosomal dipeptide transporter MFSD1 n=1 Tax=Anthostomella pinea TaxID=933095 RepID=A0AAI8VF98_9PEZI|nr:Uu.00g112680.m01.CDS01 [Anthostomella pinea]
MNTDHLPPRRRFRHQQRHVTNVKAAYPAEDDFTGAIASSKGKPNSNITPAQYCTFLDYNVNSQLNRFGLHNGGAQDGGLLNEKWESLALVPVTPGIDDGEHHMFSLSDNDFHNVQPMTQEVKGDGRLSLESSPSRQQHQRLPTKLRVLSIVIITAIGFGGHWSTGVTGAMKSTLKKELHINNAQFSVLEASEDFVITVLIVVTGMVTDHFGGAGSLLWLNALYSVGSILIAAAATVRSYRFMIVGRVVAQLGDLATQIAQYKLFSSWFPPGYGFGATVGFELGIGKIGAFVGKATANDIAKRTGNMAWVFWIAVFVNLLTNAGTLVLFFFTKYCDRKYPRPADPLTKRDRPEKRSRFNMGCLLKLSWQYWGVILFSIFETSTVMVFSQNSTELASMQFHVSSTTAGWYSSASQYGVFMDLLGNRLSIFFVCGSLLLISMCLAKWAGSESGLAASFALFGLAQPLGVTTIIDSVRTAVGDDVFGKAYGLKFVADNAADIILRIVTGVIQDADNNSYDRVIIVYVVLSAAATVVSIGLLALSPMSEGLRQLQWTRQQRKRQINAIVSRTNNRMLSLTCFVALILFMLGSWGAYFWGIAKGSEE